MKAKLTLSIVMLSVCITLVAVFPAQAKDVAGSADHPMISRYEGSRIVGYKHKAYDEYEARLGPAKGPYYDV